MNPTNLLFLESLASSSSSTKKQVNRGRWSKEEDERLKMLVEAFGEKDWHKVSAHFPDRSDIQCQQRWDKVVNPKLVKGPWTKEEDDKVVELVKRFVSICMHP